MKNNPENSITITNLRRGTTTIDVEGMIGVPEEWQFDRPEARVSTYEKFRRTVDAIAGIRAAEVVVNIRSQGGNVVDALLIYDALTALAAEKQTVVTTRCHGYVASAATIIAQAATAGRREISSNSLYLVHNSTAACEGTVDEMRKSGELLAKTDERIAAIYAEKSGRQVEEFTDLMAENGGNGRWLSPAETIEKGLADNIREPQTEPENNAPKNGDAQGANPDQAKWRQQAELDRLRHRVDTLESEKAQLQALPTMLKTQEDPTPNTEGRRSANQAAYQTDVESLLR